MIIFILINFLLSILALRSVLFTPGIIGHNWDWNIPNFAQQIHNQFLSHLSIWDNRLFGGIFYPFKLELPYWLGVSSLSLSGETFSKLLPILIINISGLSLFILARKRFKFTIFWSALSAFFYAYSPFVYSRFMAGHFPIIIGYSFLPLVFYLSYESLEKNSYSKYLLILVLWIETIHPLTMLMSLFFIFYVYLASLIEKKNNSKEIIKKFLFNIFLLIPLCAYWIFPILIQLFTGKGISSPRTWESIGEEMAFRIPYVNSVSKSLSEIFSFSIPFGLNTEFVYPFDGVNKFIFAIIASIFFALSFMALFISYKKEESAKIKTLFFLEIIGLIMVTGVKTIFGTVIYSLLIKFAPFIFSIFSNPLRLLPLVSFPLAILSFYSLKEFDRKLSLFNSIAFKSIIIYGLIIFFYPWFFRDLKTPVFKGASQPMSLIVTKINKEDKMLYDYLAKDNKDYRVSYFPPAFVSWPGETDLSYSWSSSYSPKPVMLEYSQPALSGEIIKNLYSPKTSPNLSKLMGLANIKTIIYPHYNKFAETYQDFIHGTKDYKPLFDKNLALQEGLTKIKSDFKTLDIYNNENFLPHFYIPEQNLFVNGENSALIDIASMSDYKLRSVFIIPTIENDESLENKLADEYYIKPLYISQDYLPLMNAEDLHPSIHFLPTSPLYFLTKFNENKLLKAVDQYPSLKANALLVLMSKRLAELKTTVEIKQDNNNTVTQTAYDYQNYLNLLSKILTEEVKNHGQDNELYLKSLYFFEEHSKTLSYISQKTVNGEIIRTINEILRQLESDMHLVNSSIWITRNSAEARYLFDAAESGNYTFLTSQDGKKIVSFEIDGKTYQANIAKNDPNWLYFNKMSLSKGKHQLKINLQNEQNLFPGFSQSDGVTAVKNSDNKISYQLQSRKENSFIKVYLPNLTDSSKYRVSFKVKVTGNPFRIYLEQKNDEAVNGYLIHKIDEVFAMQDKWIRVSDIFTPNSNSKEAYLTFFIPANRDETDTYLLEDINIEKVIEPIVILKGESTVNNKKIPNIIYKKISPTKYQVIIKNALNPFLLVFSETYNKNWKLYINDNIKNANGNILSTYFNGEIIEGNHSNSIFEKDRINYLFKKSLAENNHLKVNSYSNAWYIDKLGNYEIVIEFIPQRIYFFGLVFSFFGFLLIVFLLFKNLPFKNFRSNDDKNKKI